MNRTPKVFSVAIHRVSKIRGFLLILTRLGAGEINGYMVDFTGVLPY